jgi:uncharacterized protein
VEHVNFAFDSFNLSGLILDGLIVATFWLFFLYFRRRDDWISLLSSLGATAALWCLMGWSAEGVFFAARALWTTVSVALPTGMILLCLQRRRAFWGVGALLLLLFKLYGEVIEPRRLEVTRITFHSAKIHRPLRITHISDIQTDGLNGMYWRARDESDAFNPHLVLFTGDLVNRANLLPEVEGYLKSFKHRQRAFLVGGNVDGGLNLDEIAGCAGFQNLEGRTQRLTVEGNSVVLTSFNTKGIFRKLLADSHDLTKASDDFHLWLYHYPDAVYALQQMPVDLLLSGHTHGGQVCLPWFGPILTLSSVPRHVGAGGLHKIGTVWTLVNRGLGWEGAVAPRVRLFCRPQIILLEIVPAPVPG